MESVRDPGFFDCGGTVEMAGNQGLGTFFFGGQDGWLETGA